MTTCTKREKVSTGWTTTPVADRIRTETARGGKSCADLRPVSKPWSCWPTHIKQKWKEGAQKKRIKNIPWNKNSPVFFNLREFVPAGLVETFRPSQVQHIWWKQPCFCSKRHSKTPKTHILSCCQAILFRYTTRVKFTTKSRDLTAMFSWTGTTKIWSGMILWQTKLSLKKCVCETAPMDAAEKGHRAISDWKRLYPYIWREFQRRRWTLFYQRHAKFNIPFLNKCTTFVNWGENSDLKKYRARPKTYSTLTEEMLQGVGNRGLYLCGKSD